jgi:hypothetical protein
MENSPYCTTISPWLNPIPQQKESNEAFCKIFLKTTLGNVPLNPKGYFQNIISILSVSEGLDFKSRSSNIAFCSLGAVENDISTN